MPQLSRTGVVIHRMQDDVARTYRNAFGFPRLEQPRERDGAGWIAFVCAALMAGVYVAAWVTQ